MRKPQPRRKDERRKTSKGAWMLGGALPADRREGPDRRVRMKDRRKRI
jgi:hypothetical protein